MDPTKEQQDAAYDGEDKEVKRQRKEYITKWASKLEQARKHDKEYRERWADDRKWARGDVDWEVRANLIGSIMEVLAAFLYAKNPDVRVKPSPSVNRTRVEDYRKLADTAEIICSRLWHYGELKRLGKKWVRASMTTGIAWLKASMQTRTEVNPVVEEQLNDLIEQANKIGVIEEKIANGEMDETDELTSLEEIENLKIALEAQREVMVAEGLVIDVLAPEDVVVAPDCGDVENYCQAPWIAIDYYKTCDEVLANWTDLEKKKALKLVEKANKYRKRPRHGEPDDEIREGNDSYTIHVKEDDRESESVDGFVRVTEIWCKADGVVYTMLDGCKGYWLREPYAPITGRRWYPVFDLMAHPIDGERYPQSDVFQLKELQEEYNRCRSNFAEHRKRAVPGTIYNEEAVDANSVASITGSVEAEYVGVKLTSPEQDIRTVFTGKHYPAVDMNLYNTSPITQEMEKISGAQDALQSSVAVEKTATEARIQEAGFGARSGNRRDVLEDSLSALAEYTVQLVFQMFSVADAQRLAGPEAVWVEMTVEEANWMFDISIKAGSSGKPKAQNDREVWGTMLPLIEKLIDRVGQARVMGEEWAAQPWIALIDETMKRLEEPAELEKFLPNPPPPQPSDGQDPMAESEIENTEADTEKKRADVIKTLGEAGAALPPEIAAQYMLFGGKALAEQSPLEADAPPPPPVQAVP